MRPRYNLAVSYPSPPPRATSPGPEIAGALADHPAARALAAEVLRIHRRYADEVVGAFRLCPFFRDAESSFGHFCVMIDRLIDVTAACAAATRAPVSVVHLVYPRVDVAPPVFERFGNAVGAALRSSDRERGSPSVSDRERGSPGASDREGASPGASERPGLVVASFHPRMAGDRGAPARLVGLLRRAPDPFVQLVPEGLHEGGTTFAGADVPPPPDTAAQTFARLAEGGGIDRVLALLEEIRGDRDRSYAPHLAALAREDG